MLQMQVYSERTSSANGIVTNVGEDAHPFVNNAECLLQMVWVAVQVFQYSDLMKDVLTQILWLECFAITLTLNQLKQRRNSLPIQKRIFQVCPIL